MLIILDSSNVGLGASWTDWRILQRYDTDWISTPSLALGPVTSCTGSSPRLWDNKHVFFENINHTYRCVFDDDFAKDNNGGEFNMLLSI